MLKILLVILGSVVAINSLISALKWKEISRVRKLWTLANIVLIIMTSYYAWIEAQESKINKSIESKIGELRTINYSKKNKTITFDIGGAYLKSDIGVFQLPLINKNKGNFFKAWIENSRLFINMVIRNEVGEIIATIEGQTWKVYKDGYDYNNDDKGFEIVTPDKRVIFQIFMKEDLVFVRGLVLSDNKEGYYIIEKPKEKYSSKLAIVNLNQKKWEVPDAVPKIFKYPRESYFGERDLNNPLNN